MRFSGGVGGINGLANVLGDEVCNIYKLFTQSRLQEAVELHLRLVTPNATVRNEIKGNSDKSWPKSFEQAYKYSFMQNDMMNSILLFYVVARIPQWYSSGLRPG
jgi:hypothetical protein